MSSSSNNKLVLVLVPILVLLSAYFGMPYTEQFPVEIKEKLPYAPYLIFVASTLLGGFFKRHRIALVSLAFGLAYLVFHNILTSNNLANQALIIKLLAILLPLNIALIASLKERLIMSIQGLGVSVLIVAQFILAYWLIQNFTDQITPVINYQPEKLAAWLPQFLSLAVLGSFAISSITLLTFVIKSKGIFEIAFFGSLVSSILFFTTDMNQAVDTIYFSIAGLILIWGLMHNSYHIAYIDELTELPGRRAMNEELSRLRGTYSIAMLDIDFFKKFNDTYGHDVGDQVLRMVASKIRNIGGGGKPYRYGGEEFSIIFPGKDSKAAFPFLSNLRETIDSTSMILRNQDRPDKKPEKIPPRRIPWQEVHVTISIGVANSCDELTSTDTVMKAADEALYRSKEKGRNRITQNCTMDYVPDVSDKEDEVA
ncbi:MAG: GGDEF domain-containing protein [Gammaproteobacteria bacterium]|nr:GGDEF domain-containing protein [Gammaproteobacteria bacterium]